jgi:uncharacterized membrane protein YeaQ/YmgE (transglycosylase-associated protein family)
MSSSNLKPQNVQSGRTNFRTLGSWVLPALIGLLPLAWLAGVFVFDAARVLLALFLAQILIARRGVPRKIPEAWIQWIGLVYVVGFLALTLVNPHARAAIGALGGDTALFSQVIHQIAEQGSARTSLLSAEGWTPFLSHHLGLIWYAPAWIKSSTGLSAWTIGFLLNTISILVCCVYIVRIHLHLGCSRAWSILIAAAFLMLPTVRHASFWSFHDETLTLGLWAAAWFYWQRRSAVRMALPILLAMTAKESMLILAGSFAAMVLLDELRAARPLNSRMTLVSLLIGVTGAIIFYLYVFEHDRFFGKPYDHLSKVVGSESDPVLGTAASKVLYVGYLLLPLLVFASATLVRRPHLFLPALCMLSFSLVSSFTEMWNVNNYYGYLPSLFLFLAVMTARPAGSLPLRTTLIVLFIGISFSLTSTRPLGPVLQWYHAADRESATTIQWTDSPPPEGTRILGDTSSYLALLDYEVIAVDLVENAEQLPELAVLGESNASFSFWRPHYMQCDCIASATRESYHLRSMRSPRHKAH